MRKTLFTAAFCLAAIFGKAQHNTLMDGNFWKNNPTIDAVKSEIARGNSPSQQNAGFFDPVVMAINNKASNAVIGFMLEQPGNAIDKKTHHSRTYLQWAAAAGNLELVQSLLKKGSDIHYKDSHGASVIQYAAQGGNKNTAVFDELIRAGADVKAQDDEGATLMMLSVAGDDDLKLTEYFTSKGLSVKDKDQHGRTLADYAAKLGNLDIVKKLTEKGVQPTDQALFFAAQGSRSKQNGMEVYQTLISQYKLNPKAVNPNGATMLQVLVRRPNMDIIQYFLNQKVEVSKADKEGNTALMVAASGNNTQLAETLLAQANNVNAANEKGETALTNAVANGSAEMVAVLLKNGADAAAEDKAGNNLAFYWINSYKPAGKSGRNAAPAGNDFNEKMTLLQNAGLDLAAPQAHGATLLHIAADKNDAALVEIAAKLVKDVNAQDADGNSALHKAALTAKDDRILKALLKTGINKALKTEFDETAYDLAKDNEFLTKNKVSIDFLK